ncbi:MAG TPA: glycine cleavage T C-terminal barrel domain-containing protein [Phycisphaerae bacterium]|nr:glycine cleavage T C-terminal barrel domain-containing protein [Phycisphaerae bacterium]
MSEGELLKTALHGKHVAMGAKMVAAAGWEMPLVFSSVSEEVRAVRSRAGVADVSHGGRIRIRGDGAVDMLERLCTGDVVHQEDDTALYTLLCNERGGVIDHGFLLRLEGFWVLTCSPECREKVLAHLQAAAADFDAKVDDQTERTSQILVTGPGAPAILDAVLPMKVSPLPPLAARTGSLMIARYIAMRTSPVSLWGVEVILTNMLAGQAWRFITEKGGDNRIAPVGLVALDVLRVEAGLPRYGRELNETIDPITAALERAVDFGHDFLGRDAIKKIRDKGAARKLVGMMLEGSPSGQPVGGTIPGQGTPVFDKDGVEVGAVTSATFSPTLNKVIAMAYVAGEASVVGQVLSVGQVRASVVEFPFVSPP